MMISLTKICSKTYVSGNQPTVVPAAATASAAQFR
jgi:hypothetical protein